MQRAPLYHNHPPDLNDQNATQQPPLIRCGARKTAREPRERERN